MPRFRGILESNRVVPVVVLTVVALSVAAAAAAKVAPINCSVFALHVSDRDGEPHPRTAALAQTLVEVPDADYAVERGFDLCVRYSRSFSGAGRFSAKILVFRGQERVAIVKVRKTRVDEWMGHSCRTADVDLQEGDRLEWRLKFTGMPMMGLGAMYGFQAEVWPGGWGDIGILAAARKAQGTSSGGAVGIFDALLPRAASP